jgi:ABC-type multidrug transport system fused ATPase/permease subunit
MAVDVATFELEQVSLSRAGEPVLRGLSARVPGGATCVAGPSGSGKSTLLRLLDRLSDAEAGVVRYRGTDVRELDPLELRREVVLVPQLPALLDGTVADNLRFAAGLAGREPEISRLLELAGLDASFGGRDGSKLSVGEQQRAMLARALALDPRVLLLDEPTSALDPETTAAIEATLLELRERLEIDLVWVTHDIGQARRMSDWLVRIADGRAVGQGPTAELLATEVV